MKFLPLLILAFVIAVSLRGLWLEDSKIIYTESSEEIKLLRAKLSKINVSLSLRSGVKADLLTDREQPREKLNSMLQR